MGLDAIKFGKWSASTCHVLVPTEVTNGNKHPRLAQESKWKFREAQNQNNRCNNDGIGMLIQAFHIMSITNMLILVGK